MSDGDGGLDFLHSFIDFGHFCIDFWHSSSIFVSVPGVVLLGALLRGLRTRPGALFI